MTKCKTCNQTKSTSHAWHSIKNELYCSDRCVQKGDEFAFLEDIKKEIMAGDAAVACEMIDKRLNK